MKKPAPEGCRADAPETRDADGTPNELGPLVLADSDIPYPDSHDWRHLGATVRQRVAARQRRFRVMQNWAVAATLMAVAALAVLLAKSPSPASVAPQTAAVTGGAAGESRAVAAVVAQDNPSFDKDDLKGLQALTMQFELDNLALELARAGITDPGDRNATGRILENHEIDAVEVFLASRKAL